MNALLSTFPSSFPDSSVGKESAYNAGNLSLIPGSGRSVGERIGYPLQNSWASLVAQLVKNPPCNVGYLGSIPGLGRSPGEGSSNPFQYSCLENPMDWGAWWAAVHGVTKSRTWLSDFTYLLTYLLCSNRWHTIGMNHHGMRFLCLNSLF